MKFEKVDDLGMGSMDIWISGRYKCVMYGDKWFAFFKPVGWKNWGNSCEKTMRNESQRYDSLQEAQDACERHKERFGDNPDAFNSIRIVA